MRVRASSSTGASLLALGLALIGNGSLSAQNAALDSVMARELLREATSALKEAEELRLNPAVIAALAELRAAFGLDPQASLDLGLDPPDPLGELMALGEWDEAGRWIAGLPGQAERITAHHRLYRTILHERGFAATLAVADRYDGHWFLAIAILSNEDTPAEERFAFIRGLLNDGAIPPELHRSVLERLHDAMARLSHQRAFAAVDSVPDPVDRTGLLVDLVRSLTMAQPEGPARDAFVIEAIGRFEAIPDSALRATALHSLARTCSTMIGTGCGDVGLPHVDLPVPSPEALLRHRVVTSVREGDLTRADEAIQELHEFETPIQVNLLVLSALVGARTRCPARDPCTAERNTWVEHWLSTALALEPAADSATADALRVHLSRLLVVTDRERALDAAGRIRSPSMRREAYGAISSALLHVDVRGAWEAAQLAGEGLDARRTAEHLFPLFEALGDTASARSARDMMSPGQVFRVLMTRADALAGLGRWSEARRTALTALDVLTPMEVEGRRWPPHLGPALQLGLFDEIAARAIGLEDPRERALLLMALVADAAGLRVRPPLAF